MIVVSDTSPLSSLYLIDQLPLLPAVFGKIIVPEKVWEELLILEADYLLIDELEGREAAAQEGLKTIGILGVFIRAKSVGLIAEVRPLMEDLRTKARFHIHDKLFVAVLKQAGES